MTTPDLPEKNSSVVSVPGLPQTAKEQSKRVIVVGAGMAGLVAGYELARSGHDVHLLEARSCPGGRIRTWRDFPSGLHAEAGASIIAEHHKLTRQYISELGLSVRQIAVESPEALLHLNGRTSTFADAFANPETIPVVLTGAEKGKSPAKLWREATHSVRAILDRQGEISGWDTVAATYARLTLHEFLELAGWSDEAITLFSIASQRQIRLERPAVDELRELIGHARSEIYEIVGGADRLPYALFHRLADRVRFGARVLSVHTSKDDVAITWMATSGEHVVSRADYAIFTVPIPAMTAIQFHPALSRAKVRAMRAAHYGPAVAVAAQYDTRFWELTPYQLKAGGTSCTDLPTRRVTYPTHAPEGTSRGILHTVHAWQPDSGIWAAMDHDSRIRQFAADVAVIHAASGQLSSAGLEHARSYSWGADPFSGGNVAQFPLTDQLEHLVALASPEHRLVFAGEHTSSLYGTVEGAAQSGMRAASEIYHAAV